MSVGEFCLDTVKNLFWGFFHGTLFSVSFINAFSTTLRREGDRRWGWDKSCGWHAGLQPTLTSWDNVGSPFSVFNDFLSKCNPQSLTWSTSLMLEKTRLRRALTVVSSVFSWYRKRSGLNTLVPPWPPVYLPLLPEGDCARLPYVVPSLNCGPIRSQVRYLLPGDIIDTMLSWLQEVAIVALESHIKTMNRQRDEYSTGVEMRICIA